MTTMRPNVLGDVRAEADNEMLDQAFVETPDYRALIESHDRTIIVGRRGTGKSALVQELHRYWQRNDRVDVIRIIPEEYQTFALRPLASLFGPAFPHIRAGIRIAWRYAFIMETVRVKSRHYSFKDRPANVFLRNELQQWDRLGFDVLRRFQELLKSCIDQTIPPEQRIGDLAEKLKIQELEHRISEVAKETPQELVILIDCLDEGYQPDDTGIGVVDGLIQGAIDIKARSLGVKPFVFLRDNIFRSVQHMDQDYSRNIEGNVLRLHWDDRTLYDFVTRRMRIAFSVPHESSTRIWNNVTTGDLKGISGFETILRMTLYRPRDLLSLLNEAFFHAFRLGNDRVNLIDVEKAGKQISKARLDDLVSEYQALFPAISSLIDLFRGMPAEWDVVELGARIEKFAVSMDDPVVRQEMLLAHGSVVDVLFGIGFLGVDVGENTFSFCYDGRRRESSLTEGRALVHPCYWMALDCVATDSAALSEVYDEYSIETSSASPSVRSAMIDRLIRRLGELEIGSDDAAEFEQWCENAVRICFAKGLMNVERHPSRQGPLRPDIVATNVGEGNFWKRVYEDYRCRQVVFEVKNKSALDAADFQQVASYMGGDYGDIAFIITREDGIDLRRGADLDMIRELYARQKKLVVKLNGKYLCKLLRKLTTPAKHDIVNDALHRVLDNYVRLYMQGRDFNRKGRRDRA